MVCGGAQAGALLSVEASPRPLPEREPPNANAVSICGDSSALRERTRTLGVDCPNQLRLSFGLEALDTEQDDRRRPAACRGQVRMEVVIQRDADPVLIRRTFQDLRILCALQYRSRRRERRRIPIDEVLWVQAEPALGQAVGESRNAINSKSLVVYDCGRVPQRLLQILWRRAATFG